MLHLNGLCSQMFVVIVVCIKQSPGGIRQATGGGAFTASPSLA
jgi:hypothetical protein